MLIALAFSSCFCYYTTQPYDTNMTWARNIDTYAYNYVNPPLFDILPSVGGCASIMGQTYSLGQGIV